MSMISDITIGQYYKGDSFVHKLDPRAKIILTVLFVAMILRMLPINPWWSNGVYIFALLIVVWTLIRAFSRNFPARQREERRYLKVSGKLFAPFHNARRRFKERKTHIYRKCPHCRKTLRLPRVPGHHTVRCPVCRNRFDLKVK